MEKKYKLAIRAALLGTKDARRKGRLNSEQMEARQVLCKSKNLVEVKKALAVLNGFGLASIQHLHN